MSPDEAVAGLTVVLSLGIAAQWLGWRLRVPAILLLLVFGFLAGPVLGLIRPDRLLGDLLQPVIALSVAVILFEGGLSLGLVEVREVTAVVRNLVTVGVLITWAITAAGAYLILGLNGYLAVLLGAVLIVSGPTVVEPLLEFLQPVRRVDTILRWESSLIDPIGAILAVLTYHAIAVGEVHRPTASNLAAFGLTVLVGLVVGLGAAGLLVLLLARRQVPEALEGAVALALVATAFTVSNRLSEESGLMAATVMGIAVANQSRATVRRIADFDQNLRIVLVSALFILLAARIAIGDLLSVLDLRTAGFVALLVLVTRPAAALLATWRTPLTRAERAFLAWMAPRGIIAAATVSAFASGLADAGMEESHRLVPLTFAVIVITVVVYALTSAPVLARLGLRRSGDAADGD